MGKRKPILNKEYLKSIKDYIDKKLDRKNKKVVVDYMNVIPRLN